MLCFKVSYDTMTYTRSYMYVMHLLNFCVINNQLRPYAVHEVKVQLYMTLQWQEVG